jgi:hypothetical protein
VGSFALLLIEMSCAEPAPQAVPLGVLARDQERYDGRELILMGRVRPIEDRDASRYFVLEDADSNRVLLEPTEDAEAFEHQAACVRGEFRFSESTGRRLEVGAIRLLPASGSC